MYRFLLLCSLSFISLFAVGPKKVATYDRDIWPYKIKDLTAFDLASRYEIIQFVKQIDQTTLDTKEKIQAFTNIKNIDEESVFKWSRAIKNKMFNNFVLAQESCKTNAPLCQKVSNWNDLAALSRSFSIHDQKLQRWDKDAQIFYSYYLYEQVRLASLFPRITSEIATLDPQEEQGTAYQDRHFLLTFDDGPKKKRTKAMSEELSSLNIHGIFFVLGENLDNSLKQEGSLSIQKLYKDQCVGSHGYIHKPHPKLKNWKESYDKTRKLIIDNNLQGINENSIWFRPPYGQRQIELVNYIHTLKDNIMLWNIDSQDWNHKLTAKNVQDRVQTLMLLWRSGIILFHDVHDKALSSVKYLNSAKTDNILIWDDCRDILPLQN